MKLEDIKILGFSVRKLGGTIYDPNNLGMRIPNPEHSIEVPLFWREKLRKFESRHKMIEEYEGLETFC